MENDTFQNPKIPVVTNMDGIALTAPAVLKNDILESMIHPVNWMRMMEFLKNNSVRSFVEVGPGTSLSSLCRLNDIPREQTSHAKVLIN